MSANPEVMRRLRKLLELATRGVGGERENAERMLAATMRKHGVTMEQLESPTVERYYFATPTALEGKLFNQVCFKVIGTQNYSLWKREGNGRKTGVDLTHAQRLEVDLIYTMLRKQLRIEQERLYMAFIHKHRVFGTPDPDNKSDPLTHEQWLRMRQMMQGMDALALHKQIEQEEQE